MPITADQRRAVRRLHSNLEKLEGLEDRFQKAQTTATDHARIRDQLQSARTSILAEIDEDLVTLGAAV